MNRRPSPAILASLSFALISLNTIGWSIPLFAVALVKLAIPVESFRRNASKLLVWIAESWIAGNNAIERATQRTEWDVTGVADLDPNEWYLVSCNHQSWVDILVLQRVFHRRIPFLKFFLKRELIWVPVLGLAWWALDFPFMKRYPKELLEKRPELRGTDLEITRRACAKFRRTPVSIMNFMEGTRFTPEKHARQRSPYRNLLRPKAGGIAFVLASMGEQLRTMVDVTIHYPGGRPTFWDFLGDRVPKIVVRAERREIPVELGAGDYSEDPEFRDRFQSWVRDQWLRKDEQLERLVRNELSSDAPQSAV